MMPTPSNRPLIDFPSALVGEFPKRHLSAMVATRE